MKSAFKFNEKDCFHLKNDSIIKSGSVLYNICVNICGVEENSMKKNDIQSIENK